MSESVKPARGGCSLTPLLLGGMLGAGLSGPALLGIHWASDAYVAASRSAVMEYAWWQWPWGWPGVPLVEAHAIALGFGPASAGAWALLGNLHRAFAAMVVNLNVAMLPPLLCGFVVQGLVGLWRWRKAA